MFSGEIEIYFTLDFWDSLDLSSRTLLGRKQFTVKKVFFKTVADFGDLISIADKLLRQRKWVISKINPGDYWVKNRQMFEFKYFYNESRIKVDWPFPEESSIALKAETVLGPKGQKRKTISSAKNSTYRKHTRYERKKGRKYIRKKQERIIKNIAKTDPLGLMNIK